MAPSPTAKAHERMITARTELYYESLLRSRRMLGEEMMVMVGLFKARGGGWPLMIEAASVQWVSDQIFGWSSFASRILSNSVWGR